MNIHGVCVCVCTSVRLDQWNGIDSNENSIRTKNRWNDNQKNTLGQISDGKE